VREPSLRLGGLDLSLERGLWLPLGFLSSAWRNLRSASTSNSPAHIPKVGNYSQPRTAQPYEVSYDQIRAIRPITQKFARAIGLIPGIETLPYFLKKTTGIVVSTVEELVIAALEEFADSEENMEKPE